MGHARELLHASEDEQEEMKNLLISLFIGRETRMQELYRKHFELGIFEDCFPGGWYRIYRRKKCWYAAGAQDH